MRRKLIFGLLAVIGISAVLLTLRAARSGSSRPFQDPSMTGLEWRAAEGQANGETQVEIGADRVMYHHLENLDQAINDYTIVVAQPVWQKGYADSNSENVETWYKFAVSEYLVQRPLPNCASYSPLDNPPADLLPLNANEILIPRSGGDLLVNGVTIISSDPQFSSFMTSQSYLLFLELDSNSKVGSIKAGPIGAFSIQGDRLVSLFEDPHPIKDEITNRFGNSLNALRAALNPAATKHTMV